MTFRRDSMGGNRYSISVVKKAKALFESGKTIKQIARLKDMPTGKTLLLWIEQEHGGEWTVQVREQRALVIVDEIENEIDKYFTSHYVEKGEWHRVGIMCNNEVIDYEDKWYPNLDARGNPEMTLDKPLTWAALAGFLSISTCALDLYLDGKYDTDLCIYSELLAMAKDRIEQFNLEMLYNKETVNGAKFILARDKKYKKKYTERTDEDDNGKKKKLEDFFNNESK